MSRHERSAVSDHASMHLTSLSCCLSSGSIAPRGLCADSVGMACEALASLICQHTAC